MTRSESLPLLAVLALAGAMLVSALAHAGGKPPPSLTDRIAAIVPVYASRKDEPVDADEFAAAVAEASKGDPRRAALLTAIAIHEGGLSDRIRRNEIKPHEGD
jgi:hypothetical protein